MTAVANDRAMLGYGLGSDEGEAFWLLGMLETIKIAGADTGGAYGLIEIEVRPGEGSPWQGIPHTFIAGPEGGKALVGFQPFQFEGFLREVGEPAPERVLPPQLETPPDVARLIAIGARNGLEILGPPGPPPGR
jgi:hypothetical protein